MISIHDGLFEQYREHLKERGVPVSRYVDYQKWLRYYLDFCEKYPVEGTTSERVRRFMAKLGEKNQSEVRRRQAIQALAYFFEMQAERTNDSAPVPVAPASTDGPQSIEDNETPAIEQFAATPAPHPQCGGGRRVSQYSEAGYEEKSDSPEWDALLERLAEEIKVRHYSRKTLQTYARWSRSFQRFLKNKPPAELSTADVKDYLTYLAVKCHVAASTQNQAFNSLLFLYRHALKREFGELRDVPRAKKSLTCCRPVTTSAPSRPSSAMRA